VKGILVRVGINRNGLYAHFFAGPYHPNRYLTAISYQYFLKHNPPINLFFGELLNEGMYYSMLIKNPQWFAA
jgi:hypothetical protein